MSYVQKQISKTCNVNQHHRKKSCALGAKPSGLFGDSHLTSNYVKFIFSLREINHKLIHEKRVIFFSHAHQYLGDSQFCNFPSFYKLIRFSTEKINKTVPSSSLADHAQIRSAVSNQPKCVSSSSEFSDPLVELFVAT